MPLSSDTVPVLLNGAKGEKVEEAVLSTRAGCQSCYHVQQ